MVSSRGARSPGTKCTAHEPTFPGPLRGTRLLFKFADSAFQTPWRTVQLPEPCHRRNGSSLGLTSTSPRITRPAFAAEASSKEHDRAWTKVQMTSLNNRFF